MYIYINMFKLNNYQKASLCFSIGGLLLTLEFINENNFNKLNTTSYILVNIGNFYNILDAFY